MTLRRTGLKPGKPLALVFAALLGSVLLAGCGDPPPESGYVLSKGHEVAHDWTQMICAAYGKYGCTVYVPIVQHEPEHWTLCLVDDKDSKAGTCRNRDVDGATYQRYARGQHYPDPR